MIIAHLDLASEKTLGRYPTDYTCIDKNGLSLALTVGLTVV